MTTNPAASPVLSVRGGAVGYGGVPVLADIDLDVRDGEVVALLGPNGSGKSTLIRAVLGLVPLGAGTLELAGAARRTRSRRNQPLDAPPTRESEAERDHEHRAARRTRSRRNQPLDAPPTRESEAERDHKPGSRPRMGYVPQRHTIGGGVPSTVEEVVTSGRLARRRLLPPLLPARDRRIVREAVATVGLTEKLHQPVSELSGGQQRRVLIARALASEPNVLIMDEPFAGVDVPNTEILAGMLAGLVAGGLTLVIVTHEIGPIASLVDRTVVLQHGRIHYDGPPTERLLSRYGGTDPDPHGTDHKVAAGPSHAAADPAPGDLDLGTAG